jgi:hypothetical protein
MTFASSFREPVLDMVGTYGPWSRVIGTPVFSTIPGGQAWEAANRTVYHPIYIPTKCPVRRFWWVNGATVSGGANLRAALYADDGTYKPGRRVDTTGATVQGTANQIQFANANGVVARPGLHWIALGSDLATNTTIFGIGTGLNLVLPLKFQEATATPPAVATPIAAAVAGYYVFGFSTVSSP